MQLSRNLLGLIHVYAQDNGAKYLLGVCGNVYLMQGPILPVTIPPRHTPGDFQFFSYLVVYSPPRASRKRQFPTPGTSHRPQIRCFVFKIDFRTIGQPDVLTRT